MSEETGPTFHHLNNSSSQRILWLLEELQIPYNLKLHTRIESGPEKGRGPQSLFESHQLGKAPQLVTTDGRTIIEASAIAQYLIETYDKEKKFQGDGGKNDSIHDEEIASVGNTSISLNMLFSLLFEMIISRAPFFVRPIFTATLRMLRKAQIDPDLARLYKYLDEQLDGQDYFMGKGPGRADFIISWDVDFCVARSYVDLKTNFPNVEAWYQRCKARDGWKRCIEKGNGYDLTFQ